MREVERVQFGAATANDEVFQRLLRSVVPVVSRAGMLLLLASALLPAARRLRISGRSATRRPRDAPPGAAARGRFAVGRDARVPGAEGAASGSFARARSSPRSAASSRSTPTWTTRSGRRCSASPKTGACWWLLPPVAPPSRNASASTASSRECDGKLTLAEGYRTHELFGDAKLETFPRARAARPQAGALADRVVQGRAVRCRRRHRQRGLRACCRMRTS